MRDYESLKEIPKERIIVYDCETTGLNSDTDEIVQLSIVDGNGKILFNELIKPSYKKKWDSAERIHHISPEMVKDKKTFKYHINKVKEIFDGAELIVAYNNSFDNAFIYECSKHEIDPYDKKNFDVMLEFAYIYGDYNSYHQSFTWKKLITCARYYDYEIENAHDSLYDVKATLHCFYKVLDDILEGKQQKLPYE